ncbi:MAG: trimethylamine methyltransferase family protein [Desulfobacterales bacterium]|jgi:trimethylamine--corrinoid protein Co-methyltransferase|nr:trimethylamine methyltransferase family protein [Deltaproteobacteria bacterium]
MNRALINFDKASLDSVHAHSLELLRDSGIRFPSEKALALFKKHGFKVDNAMVHFKEQDIQSALETAPAAFTIEARNPSRNIRIGESNYVMAPGYGPPFIIEPSGQKRNATLADVETFCKLVHTSKYIDFNSAIVVQPSDVPSETAHLDLLLATLTLTDKPIMGSSASEVAARDSLKLAQMLWGELDKPVMISLIDSLSPLQYAPESIEALMVYAAAGQPLIVHSACTLGSTGPITIAGSLVISNATTLAGICLAQLIRPGTPLVYGLGGSPMDMRTGGYVNATPEDAKHVAIVTALGQYYNLPCRSHGTLTDSFCLDYQAGMESAVMLATAALSGVNLSLHACGTYGSMLAMSFEKFIADEDLCGAVKKLIAPVEFSQAAFAMDLIKQLGTSGNYLMQDHTVDRCRTEFFVPDLSDRSNHEGWLRLEPQDITARAGNLLTKRLAEYEKPQMDSKLEQKLIRYVDNRKRNPG